MGSMLVNSKSNWLVSIEPSTQGVQGGIIRPDAKLSKSTSLLYSKIKQGNAKQNKLSYSSCQMWIFSDGYAREKKNKEGKQYNV